jgi:hypothetical protein
MDLEESGYGLVDVLCQNLSGGTEEHNGRPQSEQPVFQLNSLSSTYGINV